MSETMLNRRQFIKQTAAATATGAPLGITATTRSADKHPRTKPNIILVLTDDQGYGDVSW